MQNVPLNTDEPTATIELHKELPAPFGDPYSVRQPREDK